MDEQAKDLFEFGDFHLDAAERCLLHNGELIPLTPKAFDTLLVLVKRSGHVVTKDELLEEVWPDAFVEEATVVQNVFTLRKALGRDPFGTRFIETVPKRGYRFIAGVRRLDGGCAAGATLLMAKHTRTQIIAEEEDEESSATGNGMHTGQHTEAFEARSETQPVSATPGEMSMDRPQELAARPFTSSPLSRWRAIKQYPAALILALLLLAVMIAALLIVRSVRQDRPSSRVVAPFERMNFNRATFNGRARHATISSDGKYVAYVELDAGAQSLWVRQVNTANDTQLVEPSESTYWGLTFSNDDNYIFFVKYERGNNLGVLYQVPVIGGTPKKVLEDLDSPISFSPDGKQVAFMRGYPATRESALMIANADGSAERRLAARTFPSFFFPTGPSWSPDGRLIACAARGDDDQGVYATVVGIEVASGAQKPLTSERWIQVGRVAWIKDSSGLVITAASQVAGPNQLWQLSFPSGEVRRITNDLNDYRGVSLTADAGVLATIQIETEANIWTSPTTETGSAKQISFSRNDGLGGLSWTPDGQLVFTSRDSGHADVWIMKADGSQKRQLTADDRIDLTPTVTPDGRHVVYASMKEGTPARLWRVSIDGSNPRQLTYGNDDRAPDCSPDSKWVVYSSHEYDEKDILTESLWKVSIDGGERVRLTNYVSSRPLISPDGKWIACTFKADQHSPWKFGVIPFEGGEPVYAFDIPSTAMQIYGWTADGRALTFVDTRNGISNIWRQPLDGGPPGQLTNFESAQIFRYDWSRDGKQLACVRGILTSDVVLIKNFR
jgi:Tol biopolymer transport system component/DNA-binding winged helix-turn-helix (wHTH) protein